jgi:tetratricopeptide (TPR) repeat protein
MDAAERADAPRLVAEALANRGAALAAAGDRALGQVQVERALRLARQEGDRFAEADVLRILAVIHQASGDPDGAIAHAHEALEVAVALGHPWTTAEIQRDLGRIFRAVGRKDEAVTAFSAAEEAFRLLGSVPRAEAMRREGEGA